MKYFIGPMSKNVVDAVIEFNSPSIGFIPSRRQLDFIGGYATSEIIKNTGMLTYLTNIRPVKRNDMQTERISFVISF